MNILIVDDEEDVRAALEVVFSHAGFQVFTAENGSIAMNIVRMTRLDCVLTDIRMPVCDGIQFLEKVREALPLDHPPIFVMTGASHLDQDSILKKGAKAVFMKPFDGKAIIKTIQNLIRTQ